MSSLPFARLNLRRNPFGEPSPEDRDGLFVGGLEDWPRFLANRHSRRFLQLFGPSGCGKTTRLRGLRARFPDTALVEWCPIRGWSKLPTLSEGILFVDDAQELNRNLLARVLRFRSVAVATQRDFSERFATAGFKVRTVDVRNLVTLSWLQEVVERRLEWARRGPGPLPRVGKDVVAGLFRQYGPDPQSIQSDLYDWYQQLEVEE